MRIFLTGATGFIGSRIIPELLQAGHTVLGLTRSDSGADQLRAAGAEPHHGSLEQPETLAAGAAQAEAVIHCAFDHNFSTPESFMASCEKEKRNIHAMGDALKGTNHPLLITSGVGLGSFAPGQPASEDHFDAAHRNPRAISELTGNELLESGLNVSFMRLPQVHDPVKQGLITWFINIARQKGVAPYVGEGANVFSAAHVLDVAKLYQLAIEAAVPGRRYNAVDEEGVTSKDITEAIARGLNIPTKSITPEEAPAYFGGIAMFASIDLPASSKLTRERTGWNPTGPTLLADLAAMDYSAA